MSPRSLVPQTLTPKTLLPDTLNPNPLEPTTLENDVTLELNNDYPFSHEYLYMNLELNLENFANRCQHKF